MHCKSGYPSSRYYREDKEKTSEKSQVGSQDYSSHTSRVRIILIAILWTKNGDYINNYGVRINNIFARAAFTHSLVGLHHVLTSTPSVSPEQRERHSRESQRDERVL